MATCWRCVEDPRPARSCQSSLARISRCAREREREKRRSVACGNTSGYRPTRDSEAGRTPSAGAPPELLWPRDHIPQPRALSSAREGPAAVPARMLSAALSAPLIRTAIHSAIRPRRRWRSQLPGGSVRTRGREPESPQGRHATRVACTRLKTELRRPLFAGRSSLGGLRCGRDGPSSSQILFFMCSLFFFFVFLR